VANLRAAISKRTRQMIAANAAKAARKGTVETTVSSTEDEAPRIRVQVAKQSNVSQRKVKNGQKVDKAAGESPKAL
jgi:hypothetical protein